jgi:hypothetical protein
MPVRSLTGAAAATGAGAAGVGAAGCAGAGAGALGVAAGGGAGFEALYDGWLLSHAASANGASSSRDGLMNFMHCLRQANWLGRAPLSRPANGALTTKRKPKVPSSARSGAPRRAPAALSGAAIVRPIIRRIGARIP